MGPEHEAIETFTFEPASPEDENNLSTGRSMAVARTFTHRLVVEETAAVLYSHRSVTKFSMEE